MYNILVIEDDELLLKMISFRLKKNGYNVSCINDGLTAMDYLKTIQVDAVITDIMMPFASGLEVISFIRNKLQLKIPIIVLSAADLEQTILEAFNLGADDFISKPFSPDELSFRLKRLLKNEN